MPLGASLAGMFEELYIKAECPSVPSREFSVCDSSFNVWIADAMRIVKLGEE